MRDYPQRHGRWRSDHESDRNNHILAYCHIAHNVVLGNHVIMSNVRRWRAMWSWRITP